jgi:hypothetical protein
MRSEKRGVESHISWKNERDSLISCTLHRLLLSSLRRLHTHNEEHGFNPAILSRSVGFRVCVKTALSSPVGTAESADQVSEQIGPRTPVVH